MPAPDQQLPIIRVQEWPVRKMFCRLLLEWGPELSNVLVEHIELRECLGDRRVQKMPQQHGAEFGEMLPPNQ